MIADLLLAAAVTTAVLTAIALPACIHHQCTPWQLPTLTDHDLED